jgi:bla regulator protein BlaR1
MIAQLLSDLWKSTAPALGNHLWQSTLFAAVAGLLTLFLRKNHAGARYWLWMTASLKFLVPFSLLVILGSYISPRQAAQSTGDFYVVMDTVSQPFSRSAAPAVIQPSIMAKLTQMLPAILAATWLCGFVAVLLTWLARWRRISSAMRAAVPVQEGREVDALRRLERAGAIRRPIRLLLSRSSLEPGIFGIARPVLVWPEGISERLEDAHLEAILAHEVWHVRRRDNLAAAFHMLVEAIFWFHPLVWWVGARLVEERERACDEQVLQLGSHPQVYAESILKICEFCVGSPLACVSGVTGADLKQRIVNIMNERITRKLDLTRKLLLTAAAAIALITPLIVGLMKPSPLHAQTPAQPAGALTPGFENVSIKPGSIPSGDPKTVIRSRLLYLNQEITATNLTLQDLIAAAYGVEKNQLSGAPDWSKSELFSIEAKLDAATYDALKKAGPSGGGGERQREFQTLLADRFHLVVHRESRALPGYSLVIAKNGPKLQQAKPGETYADGIKGIPGLDKGPAGPHRMMMGYGELIGQAVPISSLAKNLSAHLLQPIMDNTGLTGDFDFKVQWTPAPDEFPGHKAADGDRVPDPSGPSLTVAIEQQLGLRLDPQTVPREIVVIDRAEKPQFN